MTAEATNMPAKARPSLYAIDPRTKRRNAAEKRFRLYGVAAVGFLHLEALPRQVQAVQLPDVRVVVDQQDFRLVHWLPPI